MKDVNSARCARRGLALSVLAVFVAGCAYAEPLQISPLASPQTVRSWLTSGDRSRLLSEQRPIPMVVSAGDGGDVLALDVSRPDQEIVGFGAAITDASAWLIQTKLDGPQRDALMHELFGRDGRGLGFSFTRVTIGASDFSLDHYSLADTADPTLAGFSTGRMEQYVFPTVRAALAINPDLKVMASPWSAPGWMKTTGSMVQGELKSDAYPVYTRYLTRYVQAAAGAGVPTDYLSVQNEPDFEPDNYPGMRWSAAGRARFVGQNLGPAFREAKISTGILDWDHNWDKPEQPLDVLADPVANGFISGVAWHCYAGDVAAQGRVRAVYPDKDVFFTECSGGEWAADFSDSLIWITENLIIGATANGARGVLMWNLALDENHGPHAGGCGDCRGVVTINGRTGEIVRNQEYYAFGHASRFVRLGARRVAVTAPEGLRAVAFVNPDGSRAVIALNAGAAPISFVLRDSARDAAVILPAKTVATYVWPAPGED